MHQEIKVFFGSMLLKENAHQFEKLNSSHTSLSDS